MHTTAHSCSSTLSLPLDLWWARLPSTAQVVFLVGFIYLLLVCLNPLQGDSVLQERKKETPAPPTRRGAAESTAGTSYRPPPPPPARGKIAPLYLQQAAPVSFLAPFQTQNRRAPAEKRRPPPATSPAAARGHGHGAVRGVGPHATAAPAPPRAPVRRALLPQP